MLNINVKGILKVFTFCPIPTCIKNYALSAIKAVGIPMIITVFCYYHATDIDQLRIYFNTFYLIRPTPKHMSLNNWIY